MSYIVNTYHGNTIILPESKYFTGKEPIKALQLIRFKIIRILIY